jgi:hypothetical protein
MNFLFFYDPYGIFWACYFTDIAGDTDFSLLWFLNDLWWMIAFFVHFLGFLEHLSRTELDAQTTLFASFFDNMNFSSRNFYSLS